VPWRDSNLRTRFRRTGLVGSVVVTAGSEGAFWQHASESGHVHVVPVRIIDRLGAGDAFMAGLLDGFLDDDLPGGVAMGVALAAVALTTVGDQIRVDRPQLLSLMATEGRDVDR
jgi:2-dehydro-3-deoxygluconokinase